MSDSRTDKRRTFTLEQANATLPLVRVIVKDLSELSRDVIDRRQRLTHLLQGRNTEQPDVYSEELSQIEEELEKDGHRLRGYVEELVALGVEPKNGPEGLVDFPTIMDGKPAYLCWKLGEPEILYWHEIDAGFAGRQSLTAGVGAESDGDDSASHGRDSSDH